MTALGSGQDARAPATSWCQYNIEFPDRATAKRVITDAIGPAMITAEADRLLHSWWYVNKQPWRLRCLPASSGPVFISGLLADLAAEGRVAAWAPGIYEPEAFAFGGDTAMDCAHELFHHDSRHLITYRPGRAAGHLGRRETAVLLCSAMMRAAGLDLYEQADVWAKVAALRPADGPIPLDLAAKLRAAMAKLMTIDAGALCSAETNGVLSGHGAWVNAFEHAGQTLAGLADRGKLTRGLRAVLAHHVIFHANRAGLSLNDQRTLPALAKETVMGTSEHTAPAVGPRLADTSAGQVTRDEASQAGDLAERLRDALVDELVKVGLVRTPGIEAAMRAVPRHVFVPGTALDAAYANATVSVKDDESGTSISCASQPGVVALMLEQLQPQPGHKVLELGAGTGYNAALLACLADGSGHVTTIDVDDDLVGGARAHLAAAGTDNVTVVRGDGALGHPDGAPYNRIIATVGAHGIPHAWLDQLAPGGRLLVPQRLRGSVCRSIAYQRTGSEVWRSVSSEMNTFMPLRSGIADDPRRMIPVTSAGTVLLQTNSEQAADADALAGVLDQPRTVAWSGLLFGAMESAEWMELWLTCTLANGLNQLPAQRTAIDTGLLTDPYRSSTATFDKGALTYLTRRLSRQQTTDGGKLWEFGVVGHGPGSDKLAEQVIEAMHAWDREYRSSQASFEIHPLDSLPGQPRPGRFHVSTPLNQIVIEWPEPTS